VVRSTFDRRVVSDAMLGVVRSCQRRTTCELGGGAALSGAYLAHRLSNDIDLVCHTPEDVRSIVRDLALIAAEAGVVIEVTRDAGSFVRGIVRTGAGTVEMDLVYEGTADVEEPPPPIEGVVVRSLADLRASKLTCILSRSEPRDLVDLLFLDRAGFQPERDLELALTKDGGIDPGVLAWLLGQFPVRPLPAMLEPLTELELAQFRDQLRERFRRMAVPGER